jgi:hypothetical protein
VKPKKVKPYKIPEAVWAAASEFVHYTVAESVDTPPYTMLRCELDSDMQTGQKILQLHLHRWRRDETLNKTVVEKLSIEDMPLGSISNQEALKIKDELQSRLFDEYGDQGLEHFRQLRKNEPQSYFKNEFLPDRNPDAAEIKVKDGMLVLQLTFNLPADTAAKTVEGYIRPTVAVIPLGVKQNGVQANAQAAFDMVRNNNDDPQAVAALTRPEQRAYMVLKDIRDKLIKNKTDDKPYARTVADVRTGLMDAILLAKDTWDQVDKIKLSYVDKRTGDFIEKDKDAKAIEREVDVAFPKSGKTTLHVENPTLQRVPNQSWIVPIQIRSHRECLADGNTKTYEETLITTKSVNTHILNREMAIKEVPKITAWIKERLESYANGPYAEAHPHADWALKPANSFKKGDGLLDQYSSDAENFMGHVDRTALDAIVNDLHYVQNLKTIATVAQDDPGTLVLGIRRQDGSDYHEKMTATTTKIVERSYHVPPDQQEAFLEAVQSTFKAKLQNRFNEPNVHNADIIVRMFNAACAEEGHKMGFQSADGHGANGGATKRRKPEKHLYETQAPDFSARVTRSTKDAPGNSGPTI